MLSLNPVKDLQSQIYECVELSDKNLDHNDIKNSLSAVGLTSTNKILSSYPHMISGGQRQRFMIAMSILRKPNIMIADEPTTALDVTLQKQILDTLNNLKNDLNMSMLLISHDIELIKRYCDHILVMKSGVIVENQSTSRIFSQPDHAYTKQLVNFKTSKFREDFITKEDKVLQTKNLSCKYLVKDSFFRKKKEYFNALEDININIYEGESVGIVGESGSGKTTLAMSIMHLLSYEGEIRICEKITQENIGQRTIEAEKALNIIALEAQSALDGRFQKISKDNVNNQLESFLNSLSDNEIVQFKQSNDYSEPVSYTHLRAHET